MQIDVSKTDERFELMIIKLESKDVPALFSSYHFKRLENTNLHFFGIRLAENGRDLAQIKDYVFADHDVDILTTEDILENTTYRSLWYVKETGKDYFHYKYTNKYMTLNEFMELYS